MLARTRAFVYTQSVCFLAHLLENFCAGPHILLSLNAGQQSLSRESRTATNYSL